ncbi:hypothetical protein MOC03_16975 [Bacillus atrophaeus]|uniref:hypothetical protein n=2 Tax=Bacillus atrophaeus TaxID=1452 RepID=UPI00227FF5CA|nr:hypothetical protein [Bacillus atrophaeus]MCY7947960.1 hypothetical protein [Bacillus atrophaeus]MCY8098241.1 hypothetical protein [Bacillus atrophaeus]MCY9170018.1 hypothetical protein [Bacillus atrophaeus]MEC0746993.1 hypothetical protein [Bacillus atrophaeus]MEC0760459.1 hypothetical protein [Bacillus atrophaeus]
MNGLDQHLKEQTFDYLRDCVKELEDFSKTGTLVEGKIRGLQKSFSLNITQLHTMGQYVYRELALRYIREADAVTEDQIFDIEDQKSFGELIVKRVNSSNFEVIKNNIIVFKGEDFEVADFINSELNKSRLGD